MSVAFETSSIQAKYDNYSSLVSPYATTELTGFSFLENSSDFSAAINALKLHATSRATTVENYLSTQ